MNTFFPHKAVDQKPLRPSKTERVASWIIGASLVPVLALQMIGAVPLHAVRDSGLGAIGGAVDSVFDLFHGIVSAAVPHVEGWAEALPVTVVQGVYFGSVTVFSGAFAARVLLGMRREQKNFLRRVGDTRSW